MNKWTPGPWKWADDFYCGLDSASGESVLRYAPYEGMWVSILNGRADANARLIAAAPEMAAFLESFVKANAEGAATEWVTRMCECDKSARALLSRIKGK